MTKKSLARQERDAKEKIAKEQDKGIYPIWSNLREISSANRELLMSPRIFIEKLEAEPDLRQKIYDQGNAMEVGHAINSIKNDIEILEKELTKLNKQIGNRTGKSLGPKDFDVATKIGLQLNEITDNFTEVVQPTILRITARMDVAEKELILEKELAEQLVSKDAVSDVEFVETPNQTN